MCPHFSLCLVFFLPQQPTRKSNPSHPTRPRSQVWKKAPTTAWLWWSGTSHQTVRPRAGVPTPRCWPWLDGSRRPIGTRLRGATPACRGPAISPSSKGSLGKETSEVLNVYMYIFFFCSPIKGFGTITNVQRTCRRHRQTTTDYIYDIRRASTIVLFYCFFYDNHFCSLKLSSRWVISECLYYFF